VSVPVTLAEGSLGHLDLVILGSANLDLVAESSHLPAPGETVIGLSYHEHPGGKGLNQAVAAARAGAQVQLWA
jgi:ribokinase